jgi:nitrate reductase assembly molybdenum cofactor insertion protein NarJ
VDEFRRYKGFSKLFAYPALGLVGEAENLAKEVWAEYPIAGAMLQEMVESLPSAGFGAKELHALEELFTRTFDVQAITTLSVGYVLFGDDYKRGDLLVNLSRELEASQIGLGTELADHLPTVLQWLDVAADREMVAEFVEHMLYPAVQNMLSEFEITRTAKRDEMYQKHHRTLIEKPKFRRDLFALPLQALAHVLRTDFELRVVEEDASVGGFSRFLRRELDIQKSGAGRRGRSKP